MYRWDKLRFWVGQARAAALHRASCVALPKWSVWAEGLAAVPASATAQGPELGRLSLSGIWFLLRTNSQTKWSFSSPFAPPFFKKFFRLDFFRVFLDSQQNQEEGGEISYIPLCHTCICKLFHFLNSDRNLVFLFFKNLFSLTSYLYELAIYVKEDNKVFYW